MSDFENADPCLDAEEVGERLGLDSKTVDWLKNEPENHSWAVLVLTYQNGFLDNANSEVNKQTVERILFDSGATLISDNVFKFEDFKTMYAARAKFWIEMGWIFYHPVLIVSQRHNLNPQPTISTRMIRCHYETPGKLTYSHYEFFQV